MLIESQYLKKNFKQTNDNNNISINNIYKKNHLRH